ncbi:hypothetical protein EUTSA_v10020934mg [Eutrema salsugineum]|uniref:F-box domain-containing protein n=1 Tax=Eutrema salsugineum TaxID=72664 RepID=V4LV97_EUTSA|nr:putative F-box protein At3g21130 [Eutrema salsugineum]ESQ47764.1 hypothetical protein EUTSA_v10020934mg [Eutrema salsugineum]
MKKNIPEELVVEILSSVPAASLARFRLTSKRWNALIKDARFLEKHSAKGPSQPLEILLIDGRVYSLSVDLRGIQENNVAPIAKVTGRFSLKNPVSSSLEEVYIRDVFHCDGFFLCSTEDNRLVVCNPCSGETKWIKPKTSFKPSDFYALGYDSEDSRYRVLRLDQSFGYNRMGFFKTEYESYDLSSNSWNGHGMSWGYPPCQGRGVSVKGVAYWFAHSINRESAGLFCYDFSTGSFRNVSLPSDDPRLYAHVALSVTRDEQQLCFLARSGDDALETDLWIATRVESSKSLSWTKHLTLSGTDLRYQQRFTNGMTFLFDQKNKVVLSANKPRVSERILHIVGEEKYIEVDHQGAKPTQRAPTPLLLCYVPSFAPIQSSS